MIEAKKEGTLLLGVAEQSRHYAENMPEFLRAEGAGSLPFLYQSTGVETLFRDERDPATRFRRVFSFHVPALRDTLAKAKQDAEQTIDNVTVDTVLSQRFDSAAKARAEGIIDASFQPQLNEGAVRLILEPTAATGGGDVHRDQLKSSATCKNFIPALRLVR
jgi:hypothetical protein